VAGDLIPPPSPAGTPPPDPVGVPLTPQVGAAAQLEPAAAAPRGPAPFRSRFGFVWGALIGIGACAAAALGLLIAAPRESGPALAANWSGWEPDTAKMVEGAADIAAHVGLQYKVDGGGQLVTVRSSSLELGGQEIGVAVRPTGQEPVFMEGDGLLFFLSGLGPGGRLPIVKAEKKRERLLMREALELALYSFRYLEDVTMVGVLLPETADAAASEATGTTTAPKTNAVFFRPGDLLEQLQVPLAATLSPKTPRPSTITKTEAARIESLTLRNRFVASIQPLEADRNYLLLAEPEIVD
jgi:hypothetical protein